MATFRKSHFVGILLFCLAQHLDVTNAASGNELVKLMLSTYNANRGPINEPPGHPTKVEVNFYARDFFITDHSMKYVGAQLTFRQMWNDPRLVHSGNEAGYATVRDPKSLWLPDLFFSNSKKGHFNDVLEPNVLLRVYPNGDVLYSRRVTADFRCETKSSMFPFSKFYCPVIVASYGSSTKDIVLEWSKDSPVQMRNDLSLPTYRIRFQDVSTCTSRTKTGEYSCLKSTFVLELNYGSVFYLLYLPPFVLVLLAWLSFFLQGRSCKVRLPLLLVTLVLGSLCCGHSSWQSPDRLVTTAADVWSGLCLAFVLYALVHAILTRNVHCVARACGYESSRQEDTRHASNDGTLQPMIMNKDGEQRVGKNRLRMKLQATSDRVRHLLGKTGNRADIIARMLYPTAFIVANIVYWAIYNETRSFR